MSELVQCRTCIYFKEDRGVWCMNGWSKSGATGWCRFEPKAIEKEAISFCSHWTKSLEAKP